MNNKICRVAFATLVILLCLIKAQAQKKDSKSNPTVAAPQQKEEPALQPVQAQPGKAVIAIYHFTSAYGYSYDHAMSTGNAVEAGFVRSGRFTVVERNRFGIIKDEEKFKEANTAEIVAKAAKLGAKTLVTGHIIAVTTGETTKAPFPSPVPTRVNVAQISLAFKLIDVETGQILKSETILGKGDGQTHAEAMQKAYDDVDQRARAYVAEFLPQRFEFASEVEVDKKGRLQKFKIWGGSDQGIKAGDIIEIFELSYVTSPSGKKIEEKKLRGEAKVKEVNSVESSTCELQKSTTIGEQLRNDIKNKPGVIVFEYKGTVKKKGIF
ncbi:MAG: CsgG/HfaB family protein [Chitinophagaceae bacterium]|nr:CsgG/HfaB family protein [Chitinophagaceae bacterium]